ncbi:MAG: hypothetical protein VZQ84_05715 [Anaerovoracaceae bacterium]|nr:hypothetical protein [Anaerovoracaceae bacterium]
MSDIMDSAKELGAKAVREAADAGKIGRAKKKIRNKKSAIIDEYEEIGRFMYDKYLAEGEEQTQSEVLEHALRIDTLKQEIAELEQKIESIKED